MSIDIKSIKSFHTFAKKRIQEKIHALNAKVAHINSYNHGGPMGKHM